MKLKGITTIEQHVEKIVLGVFALFALAMLVLQFMGTNEIKIPGQKTGSPPDQAADWVSKEAQRVLNSLEASTTPELPSLPPLQDQFRTMVERAPRSEALALAQPYGGESIATTDGTQVIQGAGERNYVEVAPPAPTEVVAHVYEGTVDPFEPVRVPELAAFLPAQQPFDLRFVSVQASFDAAALVRQATQGTSDGEALPQAWVQGRMELLSVELVRQTLGEDGAWSNEEVVPTLPGRFSLRDKVLASDLAPRELTTMLEQERSNRAEIRRPTPIAMIAGRPWIAPVDATAAAGIDPNRDRVRELVRQLANVDKEIARLEERLKAPPPGRPGANPGGDRDRPAPGPVPVPGPKPGADGRGAAGKRGDSPWPEIPPDWRSQGGGPPPPGPTPEQSRRDREQRNREVLQKQVDERKKEREAIVNRLKDLGYDASGQRLSGTPRVEAPSSTSSVDQFPSLTAPTTTTVSVWAHDLTAKPGQTYRYAVRVWVTNPMFGNAGQLVEAQRTLAQRPAVASAMSEWTTAVAIEPPVVTFFTSAGETGTIGGAEGRVDASVAGEIYEFYYGWWRRAELRIEPGDQLRGDVELPELPVFEVEKATTGELTVKGRSTITDRRRVVAEPSFLLSIARIVGGAANAGFEVYLRDAMGKISVRSPQNEVQSELHARLRDSAEEGQQSTVRDPGTTPAGGRSGGALPPPGPGPIPVPGGGGGPIPLPPPDERRDRD